MQAELAEALACLCDSKVSVQALRREVTVLKAHNAALQTAGVPHLGTAATPEQQNATLPSADAGPDRSTHAAASGCSRNTQAPAACGQADDNAKLHAPADASEAQLCAWSILLACHCAHARLLQAALHAWLSKAVSTAPCQPPSLLSIWLHLAWR